MSTDIIPAPIDRTLNPFIDFAHIVLPNDKPVPFAVSVLNRNGKEIGFIRNIEIVIDIRNRGYICKGTRFVVESRNGLANKMKLDNNNEPVMEDFQCPCTLEVYESAIGPDAYVSFDAEKNPSTKQLRDALGCRVCGFTTDVMFQDQDGVKCEKHRGQATQILMKGT